MATSCFSVVLGHGWRSHAGIGRMFREKWIFLFVFVHYDWLFPCIYARRNIALNSYMTYPPLARGEGKTATGRQ
jgi:hypothetical protein